MKIQKCFSFKKCVQLVKQLDIDLVHFEQRMTSIGPTGCMLNCLFRT